MPRRLWRPDAGSIDTDEIMRIGTLLTVALALTAAPAVSCGPNSGTPAAPVNARDARFTELVGGADEVRVVGEAADPDGRWTEEEIVAVTDAPEVRAVLGLFRFLDGPDRAPCKCDGSPEFRILRGGQRVATLTLHHGKAVRGEIGSDAPLTESSGAAIAAWLSRHGSGAPK